MSRIGNKASYDGAMLRRFLPSKVDRHISIGRWRLKVIFKRNHFTAVFKLPRKMRFNLAFLIDW